MFVREGDVVDLPVACCGPVGPRYEVFDVFFFGQKKVFAMKRLLLHRLASFSPFALPFSLDVVHFPIFCFYFQCFCLLARRCPWPRLRCLSLLFVAWFALCGPSILSVFPLCCACQGHER